MSDVRAYLDGLHGQAPDMAALRDIGVSLSEAIAICTAHQQPVELPRVEPAPIAKADQPVVKAAVEPIKPASKPTSVVRPTFILGRPTAPLGEPPPVVTDDPEVKARYLAGNLGKEPIGRAIAMSLLHELCVMIDAERGCAQALCDAGFSWTTAKELAWLINEQRN